MNKWQATDMWWDWNEKLWYAGHLCANDSETKRFAFCCIQDVCLGWLLNFLFCSRTPILLSSFEVYIWNEVTGIFTMLLSECWIVSLIVILGWLWYSPCLIPCTCPLLPGTLFPSLPQRWQWAVLGRGSHDVISQRQKDFLPCLGQQLVYSYPRVSIFLRVLQRP